LALDLALDLAKAKPLGDTFASTELRTTVVK